MPGDDFEDIDVLLEESLFWIKLRGVKRCGEWECNIK